MKRIFIILAVLLMAAPALAEDAPGVNYRFSHPDGTGTKSAMSYNPQTGASFTFDSGNTLNADGSMTYTFGNDGGSGIVVRTQPIYGPDD
jgi:hypothetical protein